MVTPGETECIGDPCGSELEYAGPDAIPIEFRHAYDSPEDQIPFGWETSFVRDGVEEQELYYFCRYCNKELTAKLAARNRLVIQEDPW